MTSHTHTHTHAHSNTYIHIHTHTHTHTRTHTHRGQDIVDNLSGNRFGVNCQGYSCGPKAQNMTFSDLCFKYSGQDIVDNLSGNRFGVNCQGYSCGPKSAEHDLFGLVLQVFGHIQLSRNWPKLIKKLGAYLRPSLLTWLR